MQSWFLWSRRLSQCCGQADFVVSTVSASILADSFFRLHETSCGCVVVQVPPQSSQKTAAAAAEPEQVAAQYSTRNNKVRSLV